MTPTKPALQQPAGPNPPKRARRIPFASADIARSLPSGWRGTTDDDGDLPPSVASSSSAGPGAEGHILALPSTDGTLLGERPLPYHLQFAGTASASRAVRLAPSDMRCWQALRVPPWARSDRRWTWTLDQGEVATKPQLATKPHPCRRPAHSAGPLKYSATGAGRM